MKRAVILLAALAVAGCGAQSPSAAPSPTATSTAPVPHSSSPGATTVQPSLTPKPSEPGASAPVKGEITVTGTVANGVEKDCTLLRTDREVYLLLGGDRTIIGEGARVTVRGRPDPGLLSTCQQGIPFQVTEARLA